MGLQAYCQAQGGIVAFEIESRHKWHQHPNIMPKLPNWLLQGYRSPRQPFDTKSTLFRQTCRRIGKGKVDGEDTKKVNKLRTV